MGRSVVCECGQRNDLGVFNYGDTRLCLACGRPLATAAEGMLEDPFVPDVPENAFAEEPPAAGVITGFESPSGDIEAVEASAPAVVRPQERVWTGGIREAAAESASERCSKCGRAFRGDWDQHQTPTGAICHMCSIQANEDYQRPTLGERRDLYRPVPPKRIVATESPEAVAALARKKRGLITLVAVGGAVVVLAMALPVEVWIARLFSTDMERAVELPLAWHWVVRVLGFVASAVGQGVGLYVTLALMNLLYEDRQENLIPIVYLGIAFAIINALLSWGASHFGVYGPAAGILIGMALVVSFFIKLLMISSQFPLRMEGGLGFAIAWFLCSLLLGPCMRMVEWLLGGIVAAIAL